MCWIFYFSLTFFYRNKRIFFLFFFLSPRRFFCHYYFHPVYFREYKKPPKQSDIHRHTINHCQYINKVNYGRSTEYSWIERTTATGMHWWTKTSFYRFKSTLWNFFGIPQAHYLTLDKTEKSRMLGKYYSKLVPQYFGGNNNFFGSAFFCLDSLVWCLAHCLVFTAAWSSDFFWHFREKFWIWWSNRCCKF